MKITKASLLVGASIAIVSMLASGAEAISVDASKVGAPLKHFWSVGVGAGRVNEGLRCAWQEHLAKAHEECGFGYVRMHDTFNDDMFVYREDKNGRAKYNFQYVDEVYDRMLAKGVRPFVELSFFPSGIAAKDTKLQMWYRNRVTPGEDSLAKWGALVKEFATHLVARYGIDEVSRWYFEVWNEPNLNPGFADFGRDYYFQLYKSSAEALKGVDSRLRIGGPATSNFIADSRHVGDIMDVSKSVFYPQDEINRQKWKGVWIEEFLAYCEKESLPVDFISCHAYPTDYALDPVSGKGRDAIRYVHSLRDDVAWVRRAIAASAFPAAEFHITEWSSSPNSRDAMHDELPPAAYLVKAVGELLAAGAPDSLMYWTFTDVFEEKGAGDKPFHGGFGMLSFQGVEKPTFHAFRMLNALGDRILANEDSVLVTKCAKSGRVAALLCNYPESYESHVPSARDLNRYLDEPAKTVALEVSGLRPEATFEIETLDAEHGNAIAAYRRMGSPRDLTREQENALRAAGAATRREVVRADKAGRLALDLTLAPWAVALVREL